MWARPGFEVLKYSAVQRSFDAVKPVLDYRAGAMKANDRVHLRLEIYSSWGKIIINYQRWRTPVTYTPPWSTGAH